jgi:hypothetical protein
MTISLWILSGMRNVADKFVEKMKTQNFHVQNSPPPENRVVYKIMWKKKNRVGQATDDNMVHARCMLDT